MQKGQPTQGSEALGSLQTFESLHRYRARRKLTKCMFARPIGGLLCSGLSGNEWVSEKHCPPTSLSITTPTQPA